MWPYGIDFWIDGLYCGHMSTGADSETIARNILDAVEATGRTLTDVADDVGVSYSTLYRHLNYRPDLLTLSTVLKLSAALKLKVSTLIGGAR